jgi:hypothetical protein
VRIITVAAHSKSLAPLGLAFLLLLLLKPDGGVLVIAETSFSTDLDRHVATIAALAQPSPTVSIPTGWFLMGTTRKDDDPYGMDTQFDNTELPQRRVWLDAYTLYY